MVFFGEGQKAHPIAGWIFVEKGTGHFNALGNADVINVCDETDIVLCMRKRLVERTSPACPGMADEMQAGVALEVFSKRPTAQPPPTLTSPLSSPPSFVYHWTCCPFKTKNRLCHVCSVRGAGHERGGRA